MGRLGLAACLLIACTHHQEQPTMPGIPPPSPVAPWHMWGSSQRVTLTRVGADPITAATVQLARVNYRRPDSYRFWLGARLVDGPVNTGANPIILNVRFTIIVGVGRTFFQTPTPADAVAGAQTHFVDFVYSIPIGTRVGAQANNIKYVTRAMGPILDDNAEIIDPVPEQRLIEVIPAQDIQCQGSLFLFDPTQINVGDSITAEITACFAPNVHVRPDWFQPEDHSGLHADPVAAGTRSARFLGNETGGT